MSKFLDVRKKVDSKHYNFIKSGKELEKEEIPRIPTGIFTLDLLTGGGIPEGKVSGFYGKKSSGKTLMTYIVAGNYLKKHNDKVVLFVDFENSHIQKWANNFVHDTSRFHVLSPDYGEQGVDLISEFLYSDDLGMVIIDSVSMIIPAREVDDSAMDSHIALQSKLVANLLRRLVVAQSKIKREEGRYLTTLLINQERIKIGGRAFQPQTIKPAGALQDFVLSMDIQFYIREYKKANGIPVQSVHNFTIQKNKISGMPKRSGEFILNMLDYDGKGVGYCDDFKTVVEYAKRVGLIEKKGQAWYLGKKHTFKNQLDVQKFLEEDKKSFEQLKSKTLEMCLDDSLLGADSSEEESVKD